MKIFYFPNRKTYIVYMQLEGIVHQQIARITMGTSCAPLIADLLVLVFYIVMRGILCLIFTNLHGMTS